MRCVILYTRVVFGLCIKHDNSSKIHGFLQKMVLEWREKEHEDMDREAMHDILTLNALWWCGFLKFFHAANMHAQPILLETLVRY